MKKRAFVFAIKMFVLTVSLSLLFSVLSELAISKANIIISVLVLILFLGISVVCDLIGVAATSATISNKLTRNADKVAVVLQDIVGDICSILSGSAIAGIIIKIIASESSAAFLLSAALASLFAGLGVFLRALGKNYAMKNADRIMKKLGRVLKL